MNHLRLSSTFSTGTRFIYVPLTNPSFNRFSHSITNNVSKQLRCNSTTGSLPQTNKMSGLFSSNRSFHLLTNLDSKLSKYSFPGAFSCPTDRLQLARAGYSSEAESDEDFDCRFEDYFNRRDIDGWEVRQGINSLVRYDVVPDPRIICAVLRACRRVSDYSLAVRFLEAVKFKCGGHVNTIYPYILQEIRPTLCELGVDTPEELGYDKPELYLESVDDIH